MHSINKNVGNSFQEFGSQNNNVRENWIKSSFRMWIVIIFPSIVVRKIEITPKPIPVSIDFGIQTGANFMQKIYWNMQITHSAQVNSKWIKNNIPQFAFGQKNRRVLYFSNIDWFLSNAVIVSSKCTVCSVKCLPFRNQCWLHLP